MPQFTWTQNNFNAGEWSPLAQGRSDIGKYNNALATCLNYIPTAQGGLTRRPGTRYVASTKNNGAARLVRFEFSTTQAYVLEVGDQYVRFYANNGRLESPPGTPVEVATPYLLADIWNLQFTQSADVLYITHPSYAPRKLIRTGATTWTLSTISFSDGPYLPINTTATTLTPSATTGAITITASAALFSANDVGRVVRIRNGANWGWATITAFTSATVVNATVGGAFSATTAVTAWRLGVWSPGTGYPSCVTFHQDRLVFAGPTNFPGRIDGSNVSDYENFAPSNVDGTVVDSNAFSFTLNSNTVNAVQWMQSDENGLLCGTAGGEWVLAPSSITQALTATNVVAKNTTSYGSTNVAPVKMGKALLFVQRTGRKLREMIYSFAANTFQAQDVSLTGEHLTKSGIRQMAAQLAPQPIIWIVRTDGTLVGVSYDRDQEILGWHQHRLGGFSDAGATAAARVESVAAIPAPSVDRDQVWVIVQRIINGATVRYVEYLNKMWEDGDDISDAVFMDSSAVYSGASTTTISGLTWLVGQTVKVLLNGAVHPDRLVSVGGSITLQRAGTKAQIGLGTRCQGTTLRIEAGGGDGPAQGKLKKLHRVVFRFVQSVGLTLAPILDGRLLTPADQSFRSTGDRMDTAIPPFTGDRQLVYEGSWDRSGQVNWYLDDPLPSNITLIQVQGTTSDGR